MFSQRLLQLPSLPDISEQVTASTNLHDIDPMTLSFKSLIQPNNILMSSPLQYFILLFNLPQTSLICHKLLSYGLQGHKLASEPIYSQIDLAKSPFADDFADLITINSCCKICTSFYPLDQ